jgi:hypothetical protein
MAFNPFTTFQRNRKFWMALMMMVCMVTFVFCTGMRGDMQDRIIGMFSRRGTTIAEVGGYSVTSQEISRLREQRNMANEYMRFCAEAAIKRLKQEFMESRKKMNKEKEEGKQPNEQVAEARKQMESMNVLMQSTLDAKKKRPRFFDIGTKLDDMLEFKLWQVQADRMGIFLEDEHVKFLFHVEFFDKISFEDSERSLSEVQRNIHTANRINVMKALGEEYRVQIAQLAVMGAQPYSFFYRAQQPKDGSTWKFFEPNMPDEIRAPLTFAQLLDSFNTKRLQFEVDLIPVPVHDFAKLINKPDGIALEEYFEKYRNKEYNPASPDSGLLLPSTIKLEYLYADPASPAYQDAARLVQSSSLLSLPGVPMESPLITAARFMADEQAQRTLAQGQYDFLTRRTETYLTTNLNMSDGALPIVTYLAGNHPQAAASLIAQATLANVPNGDIAALAGYVAWGGATAPPAAGSKQSPVDAAFAADRLILQAGERAEARRRSPEMVKLFGSFGEMPEFYELALRFGAASPMQVLLLGALPPPPSFLPIEVVQPKIEEMLASRRAEKWARTNISKIKRELDSAAGDPAKFKRVLNKYVAELKLSRYPHDNAPPAIFNRYNVDQSIDLKPLKDSYEKYWPMINNFEGRSSKPEKLLTADDFYKMFFGTEDFAATAIYKAMPWPPPVHPAAELLGTKSGLADQILQKLQDNDDPDHMAPLNLLFENADKPFLYWKTADVSPPRPTDYRDIGVEIGKMKSDEEKLSKIKAELDQLPKAKSDEERKAIRDRVGDNLTFASRALGEGKKYDPAVMTPDKIGKLQAELKVSLDMYLDLQKRIENGYRLDATRTSMALPQAFEHAKKLVEASTSNARKLIDGIAEKLHHKPIELKGVTQMYRELSGQNVFDYSQYRLPKDPQSLPYPRDDMAQQVVNLYELKKPIAINDPDLDKINRELFDNVKTKEQAQLENAKTDEDKKSIRREWASKYVQVLTNKPRTVFYIAALPEPPLNPFGVSNAFEPRDFFLMRAQQEAGQRWRAGIVDNLKKVLGYTPPSDEMRKQFDERSGD